MDDRTMIAAMCLQGLLVDTSRGETYEEVALTAIDLADSLLAKIQVRPAESVVSPELQKRIDAAQASLAEKDAEIARLRALLDGERYLARAEPSNG